MKQKDIAILLVIVFVAAVISFLISNKFFSSKGEIEVESVDSISAEFATPSNKHFNNQSVNPSALVEIGNSTNPDPFNGSR